MSKRLKRSAPNPPKSTKAGAGARASAASDVGRANKQSAVNDHRRGLGCSIAGVVLFLIIVAGVGLGTPWLLTVLANGSIADTPLTAGAAHGLLVEQRDQANTLLGSYGWVDQAAGIARVPITEAITMLAGSDLPVGLAAAVPPTPEAVPVTNAVAAVDLTNVNYTDNIQPIFQQHCAECHGNDNPEEGLILTNYKDAMLGSIYGKVIIPGDPDKSYLVELVSTGQMPKKGAKLTATEVDTIVAWINAGAPEHGAVVAGGAVAGSTSITATAALTTSGTITASAPLTASTPFTSVAITPENVSFAADVLPIFQDRCSECHGAKDPEEELVLTSYKDAMLGSVYGKVIIPGDPGKSYLVEMVSTGQMPKKGADLTKVQIDTIVAWIEAGAPDN